MATAAERRKKLESNKALCVEVYSDCRDELLGTAFAARDSSVRQPDPDASLEDAQLVQKLLSSLMDTDDVAYDTVVMDEDQGWPLKMAFDAPEHPKYESCAPAAAVVNYRNDDPHDHGQKAAPFLPYADDPAFDAVGYLEHFNGIFAWESMADPDGTY
jgi:hypothetical protein